MTTKSYGKPLRYSLKNHRQLRVGDYRVVYRINETESTVIIVATKHQQRKHSAL
ncbi:MAG TPA: type II toxin-antitoxin system RelE/ParE family toxin [Gammaproteobacteria bacterium]|nr:type II toxin-antitoxin system RelE/ParE family toxin [Gammaproteobacteria bacterium]